MKGQTNFFEDRRDRRTDDLLLLSFHNSTKHLSLFSPFLPFKPFKPFKPQ